MGRPSWHCDRPPGVDGEPICENNDDAPKTNLVVGVVDVDTSKSKPLDPAEVVVEVRSLLSDQTPVPLTKKSSDPAGGGVFFRFEGLAVGWYEVRAVRTAASGTTERTTTVHVVKVEPPRGPADEHHAVTLVLETPPAILQDYVVALNFAVAALENRPFATRGTSSSTFDEDYWELIPDFEYGQALRIKDGILPAEAVAAIIVVPSKWTFDCGEFTQACQMYARLRSIGAVAYNREAGRLTLRLSESPGRGVFERLYREFGITATGIVYGDVMRRGDGEYVLVEQALDEAPIGSTVTWTNPNEPETSAWHNENTLKLGADSFHAHGLPAHQYTRKDFEAAYREKTAPGDVYVTRLEFVRHRGTR